MALWTGIRNKDAVMKKLAGDDEELLNVMAEYHKK
jgi:hypothetical protein